MERVCNLTHFLAAAAILLTNVVLGIGQCGTQFIGFESDILMVCNQSRSLKQGCTADGEGLTVGELITSSWSKAPACEFINSDAMNLTCLRSNSGREKEYDQVFAQILDAVSGKHEIQHLPTVNPLPMEEDRMTPFIAFKKSCKPVDPDNGEGAQSVIDICTNRTINYRRVYLMLNSEKHVDVLTEPPVMCHCTLQADFSITLQALDVRLQNSSNNQCVTAKHAKRETKEFKSEEKSVELKCQDRPWFGLETLFEGTEISMTLRTDYAPKMVWIEGRADKSPLTTITVSCRTELEGMVNNELDENPGQNAQRKRTSLLQHYLNILVNIRFISTNEATASIALDPCFIKGTKDSIALFVRP